MALRDGLGGEQILVVCVLAHGFWSAPRFVAGRKVGRVYLSTRGRSSTAPGACIATTALSALDEVDDQRHAVHAVARAHPVLQEVGVVTCDPRAGVDLDRKARRAL